ncbi:unnamed protein product, partial [Ectocarpus sp. 12 AP-2014]
MNCRRVEEKKRAVYRHFQRFSAAWSVVSAPRAAKAC